MSFTPIWRPANLEPHSQQMALRSYFCSRNCLGKSFPAQKSIVRELELTQAQNGACACHCFQVTCNLVTRNPLDWLLFVSAKNKPRLVLPLTAAGRSAARRAARVGRWVCTLCPRPDMGYEASSCWCGHQGRWMFYSCLICTASRLPSAFPLKLGTWWPWAGAVVICTVYFFLWWREPYKTYFYWTSEELSTNTC